MLSNTWVTELVSRHATSGVLVDANLLFVLVTWELDRTLVSQTKGTREYTLEDAQLIAAVCSRFSSLYATPNTLTEVSNLIQRNGAWTRELLNVLGALIADVIDEKYVTSAQASDAQCYDRLGLADAGISLLAAEDILVFTNDLDLSIYLESRELPYIHYDRMLRPQTLED